MIILRPASVFLAAVLCLAAPLLRASAQTVHREERSLLEMTPVSGAWQTRDGEVSSGGRVFPEGAILYLTRNQNSITFSNRGQYDLFEAWVGLRDNVPFGGRLRFRVKADGKPVYTSEIFIPGDKPQKISVPIRGCSGFTLEVFGTFDTGDLDAAMFANPKVIRFVRDEPTRQVLPPPPATPRSPLRVLLNGQMLTFGGASPQRVPAGVLVPMRSIFEPLGARVRWSSANQTIHALRAGTNVQMQIGSYTAQINKRPVDLDLPPKLAQGTALVPLRFVAQAMGAQVNWNEATNLVTISSR